MALKIGQKVNIVGKIESINKYLVGIEIQSDMGSSFVFVDRKTVEEHKFVKACFPLKKCAKVFKKKKSKRKKKCR